MWHGTWQAAMDYYFLLQVHTTVYK